MADDVGVTVTVNGDVTFVMESFVQVRVANTTSAPARIGRIRGGRGRPVEENGGIATTRCLGTYPRPGAALGRRLPLITDVRVPPRRHVRPRPRRHAYPPPRHGRDARVHAGRNSRHGAGPLTPRSSRRRRDA